MKVATAARQAATGYENGARQPDYQNKTGSNKNPNKLELSRVEKLR